MGNGVRSERGRGNRRKGDKGERVIDQGARKRLGRREGDSTWERDKRKRGIGDRGRWRKGEEAASPPPPTSITSSVSKARLDISHEATMNFTKAPPSSFIILPLPPPPPTPSLLLPPLPHPSNPLLTPHPHPQHPRIIHSLRLAMSSRRAPRRRLKWGGGRKEGGIRR